jgi:nucleoside-diphosphate-sugar epimerase
VNVVVTGAAGLLGRHVVAALARAGHDVRAVDRRAPAEAVTPFVAADLTDLGAAIEALAGAEAVVHAAALPRPTGHTAATVFRTNVLAAHNVVEAAVLHGARRLLNASSVSVLGWPFNPRPLLPAYLPLDEAHPCLPQEAYGLSKQVGEQIVAAATRRSELTAVSLRMPWIQTAATFAQEVAARRDDPSVAAGNLWSYLDADDAADAFLAALERPSEGHRAVFLSAADTFMEQPTAALVAQAFGDVELRRELPGHASVIDGSAARELLGLRPRRSWRDYAGVGAGT